MNKKIEKTTVFVSDLTFHENGKVFQYSCFLKTSTISCIGDEFYITFENEANLFSFESNKKNFFYYSNERLLFALAFPIIYQIISLKEFLFPIQNSNPRALPPIVQVGPGENKPRKIISRYIFASQTTSNFDTNSGSHSGSGGKAEGSSQKGVRKTRFAANTVKSRKGARQKEQAQAEKQRKKPSSKTGLDLSSTEMTPALEKAKAKGFDPLDIKKKVTFAIQSILRPKTSIAPILNWTSGNFDLSLGSYGNEGAYDVAEFNPERIENRSSLDFVKKSDVNVLIQQRKASEYADQKRYIQELQAEINLFDFWAKKNPMADGTYYTRENLPKRAFIEYKSFVKDFLIKKHKAIKNIQEFNQNGRKLSKEERLDRQVKHIALSHLVGNGEILKLEQAQDFVKDYMFWNYNEPLTSDQLWASREVFRGMIGSLTTADVPFLNCLEQDEKGMLPCVYGFNRDSSGAYIEIDIYTNFEKCHAYGIYWGGLNVKSNWRKLSVFRHSLFTEMETAMFPSVENGPSGVREGGFAIFSRALGNYKEAAKIASTLLQVQEAAKKIQPFEQAYSVARTSALSGPLSEHFSSMNGILEQSVQCRETNPVYVSLHRPFVAKVGWEVGSIMGLYTGLITAPIYYPPNANTSMDTYKTYILFSQAYHGHYLSQAAVEVYDNFLATQ